MAKKHLFSLVSSAVICGSLVFILNSCEKKAGEQPQTQQMTQPAKQKQFPSFNGNSAFNFLLEQTNFGPRSHGTDGHKKCLEYLQGELKKSAEKIEVQPFSQVGYNESLHLANVFAQYNLASPYRILLTAHWDTRPRGEEDQNPENRNMPIIGANDGASGVAVLLELAKIFKDNPPPIGVDILLTDGEDYGDSRKDGNTDLYFLGAKHFAKTKRPDLVYKFGILLDMVGDRDLQLPLEQNSMRFNPQLMDLVWSTAEEVRVTQFVRVPGESISDDHFALNEAGIPTIDIIDFQYPHWHTHQDTPDKCSSESLEAVGTVLSALIYTKLVQ